MIRPRRRPTGAGERTALAVLVPVLAACGTPVPRGTGPDGGAPPSRCPSLGLPVLPLGTALEGRVLADTEPGVSCETPRSPAAATYAIRHAAGWLRVEADTYRWSPLLELRDDCATPSAGRCVEAGATTDLGGRAIETTVTACVGDATTYAVLDGHGRVPAVDPPGDRDFEISAQLTECPPELRCDDEGGCVDWLSPGEGCDDAPVLEPGRRITGDTTGLADDVPASSCAAPTHALDRVPGPSEGVYRLELPGEASVEIHASAVARVLPGPPFRVALWSGCGPADGELACGGYSTRTCAGPGSVAVVVEGEAKVQLNATWELCSTDEPCQRGFCLPPLVAEAEPNDVAESAQRLESGAVIGGSFRQEDDVDHYVVTIPAGRTLVATTERGCEVSTTLALLDAASAEAPIIVGRSCAGAPPEVLACGDGSARSGCGAARWTATADTTVLIRVQEREYLSPWPTDELHRYVLIVALD